MSAGPSVTLASRKRCGAGLRRKSVSHVPRQSDKKTTAGEALLQCRTSVPLCEPEKNEENALVGVKALNAALCPRFSLSRKAARDKSPHSTGAFYFPPIRCVSALRKSAIVAACSFLPARLTRSCGSLV